MKAKSQNNLDKFLQMQDVAKRIEPMKMMMKIGKGERIMTNPVPKGKYKKFKTKG